MLDKIKNYKKSKYETLNTIEINKSKLLHNLHILQEQRPKSQIIPVLKANAYGHGLMEICQILKNKVKTVAVDSFPEVQVAYKYFKGKVLIMGEMSLDVYKYTKLKQTEFYVYNYSTLRHLALKFGKKAKIYLFVNTGMNREGIKDLNTFLNDNTHYLNKVDVIGLASHLSSAETLSDFNNKQEENFNKALEIMKKNGYKGLRTHLGNSAGVFTLKGRYSAYRAGIGFYGYNILSSEHEKHKEANNLKPVLKVLSKIVAIQDIKTNEVVSYNENFITKKNTKIGVIPFGYSEGLPRALSNTFQVKIKDENGSFYVKISGDVCMNLTCLDLKDKDIKVGKQVEVISSNKNDLNTFKEVSNLSNTIIYEPLIRLASNIRRKVV